MIKKLLKFIISLGNHLMVCENDAPSSLQQIKSNGTTNDKIEMPNGR
jgi:hypothetical protein